MATKIPPMKMEKGNNISYPPTLDLTTPPYPMMERIEIPPTGCPPEINEHIRALAESIVPGIAPVYLDTYPEPYAERCECFPAVAKKIRRDGGTMQVGWQLWEKEGFFVEAEFHSVWKSETGELRDITPKGDDSTPEGKILFLADAQAQYEDMRKDNVRRNTCGNLLVDDFIKACEKISAIEKKGERASEPGKISIPISEFKILGKMEEIKDITLHMAAQGLSLSTACFCGSGKPYKKCHRRILKKYTEKD